MPDRITYLDVKFNNNNIPHYKNIRYPEIPLSRFDLYVTTTIGDRLDLLANFYYNNPELWWVIATANYNVIRRDSYVLKEGLKIRIPQDINAIYRELEKLNQS